MGHLLVFHACLDPGHRPSSGSRHIALAAPQALNLVSNRPTTTARVVTQAAMSEKPQRKGRVARWAGEWASPRAKLIHMVPARTDYPKPSLAPRDMVVARPRGNPSVVSRCSQLLLPWSRAPHAALLASASQCSGWAQPLGLHGLALKIHLPHPSPGLEARGLSEPLLAHLCNGDCWTGCGEGALGKQPSESRSGSQGRARWPSLRFLLQG